MRPSGESASWPTSVCTGIANSVRSPRGVDRAEKNTPASAATSTAAAAPTHHQRTLDGAAVSAGAVSVPDSVLRANAKSRAD